MPRSQHGGRHELGQNFLIHRPTIDRIAGLTASTCGPILELGAGDGALTVPLARLRRPLTAIDIDEHRVARLARTVPGARVSVGDALSVPFADPVIVGNLPFHLTTPILRRLLAEPGWYDAILLVQWEVARKRAGVGGGTMMSAQAAPWFEFELHGRVPARAFSPMPSIDGGILAIRRRPRPRVPESERRAYDAFVRRAFTARGGSLGAAVRAACGGDQGAATRALQEAGVASRALPRSVGADQWPILWRGVSPRRRRS